MQKRVARYTPDEAGRMGKEIYHRDIAPTLGPDQKGLYVAIDIETGMYEIDAVSMKATHRLYERRPEAQPWLERVGYRAVYHSGGNWED